MLYNFYKEKVCIPQEKIDILRNFRKINEKRLIENLKEDIIFGDSQIKIIEQGSIAMGNAIKSKEYDIDLAVIFSDLETSVTSEEIKNVVLNAFILKDYNFKEPPEIRSNAVTLWYATQSGFDYHVDFAIYKEENGIFYHGGKEWKPRDPKAIKEWFIGKKQTYTELHRIVRLIKYAIRLLEPDESKRVSSVMLSVLIVESFDNTITGNLSLAEILFSTIEYICKRLAQSKDIYNPTNKLSLNNSEKDNEKIINLFDIIKGWSNFFANNKNETDRLYKIFNDSYFETAEIKTEKGIVRNGKYSFSNVMNQYNEIFHKGQKINFILNTNIDFDEIKWIVENSGVDAQEEEKVKPGSLRYFLMSYKDRRNGYPLKKQREIAFTGTHTMTCQVIKNGEIRKTVVIPVKVA